MSQETHGYANNPTPKFHLSKKSSKATKSAQILKMVRRKNGASLTEIQSATGWQAHTVRGFLSGTLKKRMGFEIISTKDAKGVRRYRVAE